MQPNEPQETILHSDGRVELRDYFSIQSSPLYNEDFFSKISNGGPGVENRMSLIYHHGVAQGRINLNRFVELTSTAAAKIFGLFPKKGTIAVGSDADIVIFDPNREQTISAATHHLRVDYSAYEGWAVTGVTEVVLSRGNVIVENGEWKGAAGAGQFIKRGLTGRDAAKEKI
ncbi:MAG: amidohydrolase family protein [Blastocatellia bacterium]|nr:amidohydrolase family protein [Blastocatellia bacterium]